ncbi:MotR [Methylobacillus caricis]|uniref:MinD/ParA family ATP-binding protein n=1 Tax=Methylobacillus caricis TaxID=1971611 RepID=UPI001CFF9BA8|nr:MotR [Methylobacillus caricis]MCB5187978.1 MotR [Methylobacillus caricis]
MINHRDQATGLRRLMAGPRPKILSILSAAQASEQTRLLTNLAASLLRQGSDVMVLEATQTPLNACQGYEFSPAQSSWIDAARRPDLHHEIINTTELGYSVAKLLSGASDARLLGKENTMMHMERMFINMARQHEIVLVDATLNSNDTMPLNMLNTGEILIHMTRDADSITAAYRLIKQLCNQVGRRSFGVLVSHATEAQAKVVFHNIAEVAQRYLHIELEFVGLIPNDEHLGRAAKLGRAVIDAFPMAKASTAFKTLARKIDHNHGLLQASFS